MLAVFHHNRLCQPVVNPCTESRQSDRQDFAPSSSQTRLPAGMGLVSKALPVGFTLALRWSEKLSATSSGGSLVFK